MINRIYPYKLPDNADPWAGLLVNAGNRIRLDSEGLNILAQHLRDVGFVHFGDQESRYPIVLSVGVKAPDATLSVAPGEAIDWEIPGAETSCVWIDGDTPSSVLVDDGHLRGQCAVLGTWRFTIIVGPKVMYESGYAGSPLEPGEWIPITHPRAISANGEKSMPVDLSGLSLDQLDSVIAAAQRAKEIR